MEPVGRCHACQSSKMMKSDNDVQGVNVESTPGPWKSLTEYVIFKREEKDKYVVECKECVPKKHEISCHKSSMFNVKNHFQKKHPTKYAKIVDAIKSASNRGKRSVDVCKSTSWDSRPMTIDKSLRFASGSAVMQKNVDRALLDLVILDMLPLRIVESVSFRKYSMTLNPSKVCCNYQILEEIIKD
ncbi:unnamed protein product [Anisakis simplex]|uniref:BED-type domain-containing protein n=1 Tax=Anisakis simplex TaxID=6269 RepID=A0A0M3K2X1_ANISI|nr:unnamed protein product [Anisakis simplex]